MSSGIKALCVGIGATTLLACATGTTRVAPTALDWDSADERWSIHVVTVDKDGADRVTRIWMAVHDGDGVFRTNDSRWWGNLSRDARIRVRTNGLDHPFSVEFVDDYPGRVAIDEVFLQKYGGWEKMMFSQARGETHDNYGRLVAD